MHDSNRVGNNISKLRKSKGISIGDLAKAIGCHRTNVEHWESGQYLPSKRLLFKLLQVLDVDYDTLYNDDVSIIETNQKEVTKLEIGDLIRKYRINSGYSVKTLADLIGIHPCTIYYWESGKRFPRIKYFYRLCNILNIDVIYRNDD